MMGGDLATVATTAVWALFVLALAGLCAMTCVVKWILTGQPVLWQRWIRDHTFTPHPSGRDECGHLYDHEDYCGQPARRHWTKAN